MKHALLCPHRMPSCSGVGRAECQDIENLVGSGCPRPTNHGGIGAVPRVSLRDARIRTKLAVVLLIPVISTLGLAAALLTDSGRQAASARLATGLADVSQKATALSDAVHHERMTAAAYAAKTITNTSVLKSFFSDTDT